MCFIFDSTQPATTLSASGSQGSRNGNLGLEDGATNQRYLLSIGTLDRNQVVDRAGCGRLEFATVELVLLTERIMTLVKIIVITVLIILSILLFGRFLF